MGAGTSEEIQERIAAALALAERICAKARIVVKGESE